VMSVRVSSNCPMATSFLSLPKATEIHMCGVIVAEPTAFRML
jgi:hypothetical protein